MSSDWRCVLSVGYQAGFSLVELLVAITILGVVTVTTMAALGGGADSKTAALNAKMNEVANAVVMYQKTTGCVPSSVAVLFDKTQAGAAHNFCGVDTTASYGNQNYMSAMPMAGNGVGLSQIGLSGAVLSLRQNLSGTTPNNYAIEVTGLGDVLIPALSACNGVDYSHVTTGGLPQDFTGGANCVYVVADNAMGFLINRY